MRAKCRTGVLVLLACAASLPAASGAAGQLLANRPAVEQGEAAPLALGGYCVVTLRDRQQWQPGDAAVAATFDGQQYRFASRRERDIFAAAPQDYVPMLGGDSPVIFAEEGERVRGQLEFGILHGGSRLVFFTSEEGRRRFLDEPKRYDKADLALGGLSAVSRRDEGRDVAGIPEAVAIHRGLQYLFADGRQRSLFLKNPGRYDGSDGGQEASLAETPPARPLEVETNRDSLGWRPGRRSADGSPSHKRRHEEDVILGALPVMAGYCPVTLKRDGAWVRGRYEYRKELGGLIFLTAGPNERDALASDPAAYVPALGGDCVVSFVARNERVRGSIYHAYEYESRLFLFADAERKAAFNASPARYAAADHAAEGMCVVTRTDEGRDAPGLPQHAAWHAGKLYRFAGDAEKQKFLADPKRYAVE